MSLIHIDDGDGSTMELVDIEDGFRICTFFRTPEEMAASVKGIKKFKCVPGDIFVCASMKSGTHWTWEIISMLCNRKAEIIKKSKINNMLEAMPHDSFEELTPPRVLNTHVPFSYLPEDIVKLNNKIVFVLRNPKDVIVSHYNHVVGCKAYKYDGKWDNFYRKYMEGEWEYGSWFDYTKEWYDVIQNRTDLNIHVVYYEDLKKNTLAEVHRLAEFLEIENNDDLFESIALKCQFDHMTKEKVSLKTPEEMEKIFANGFTLYRKGEHGDWMNWFTVAQSEHFDRVYDEKMAGVKFNFRFRPDK